MLFITNALGDVGKAFPSQVHQFSNNASEIILLAPIGGAATCSFVLPNGARTTPELLTPDGEHVLSVKFGDEIKSFYAWRSVLPYSVTEYSGTVNAQFSIYTGTQTITTSYISFSVENGANSLDPGDPPGDPSDDESIYSKIMAALGDLSNKYTNDIAPRLQEAEADIAAETTAREAADTALNGRLTSAEEGLAAEVAARESLQNDVETELAILDADKLDKETRTGLGNEAYCTNGVGGQVMIPVSASDLENSIARRTETGELIVADAESDGAAVTLRQLNGVAVDFGSAISQINGVLEQQGAAIENAVSNEELNSAVNTLIEQNEQSLAEAKAYTDLRFSQFDLVVVVSELPATGEENKLYLLTKENGEAGDLFEEYIWVNGAWELQGSASLDLSGYATTAEMEAYVANNAFPKLEGVAAGYRLVGIKSNGEPVLYVPNNSSAEANSVAQRGAGGTIVVGTPTADNHAAPKAYVDDGLDGKLSKPNGLPDLGALVSVAANGDVSYVGYGSLVAPYELVIRDQDGTFRVPTPTHPAHPASKQYVDEGLDGKLDMYTTSVDTVYLYGVHRGVQKRYVMSSDPNPTTIAQRVAGGALSVGKPTQNHHATTKAYVDARTVQISIAISQYTWENLGQAGPDANTQTSWGILLSDLGITDATKYKSMNWSRYATGTLVENGSQTGFADFMEYGVGVGGKVQIASGRLVMLLGAQSPADVYYDGDLRITLFA